MVSVGIAKKDNIEQISAVLAASWKTAYRGIVDDAYLNGLPADHWVEFLTAGLSGDNIFSMVLKDGDKIIGASVLCKTDNQSEVHMMSIYLLPDKIGRGLGHFFYNEIEKEMINRGFNKCVLDVLEDNKRAISFYKSHGFTDTKVETKAILGEHSYICKIFEKAFS